MSLLSESKLFQSFANKMRLRVLTYVDVDSGAQDIITKPEAIRLDDKTTNKVTYVGYAAIGSLESAAVWKILKITEVVTGIETSYADSDANYDNIWDNRVSLTYG